MPLLELTTVQDDAMAVLSLAGELDLASAPRVTAEIDHLLADGRAPVLVLDLRDLDFMDSSGLRTVLLADTRARQVGRRLAVVGGSPAVSRVFEMTGMKDRLTFVAEPAAAAGL